MDMRAFLISPIELTFNAHKIEDRIEAMPYANLI